MRYLLLILMILLSLSGLSNSSYALTIKEASIYYEKLGKLKFLAENDKYSFYKDDKTREYLIYTITTGLDDKCFTIIRVKSDLNGRIDPPVRVEGKMFIYNGESMFFVDGIPVKILYPEDIADILRKISKAKFIIGNSESGAYVEKDKNIAWLLGKAPFESPIGGDHSAVYNLIYFNLEKNFACTVGPVFIDFD